MRYAMVFFPDGARGVAENPSADLVKPMEAVDLVRSGKRAYVDLMDAKETAVLLQMEPDTLWTPITFAEWHATKRDLTHLRLENEQLRAENERLVAHLIATANGCGEEIYYDAYQRNCVEAGLTPLDSEAWHEMLGWG